jgi:hypothetical protein
MPPENGEKATPGGAGGTPGGGERLWGENVADNTRPRSRRQLSPLEIAARLVPHGGVPAVIRDRGRLIPHHCPRALAERLPVEGRA